MKLEARLMTCYRGHEHKPPEEVGGYMPIEPYEILNADETIRALVKTINYNVRMYEVEVQEARRLRQRLDVLNKKLSSKWEIFKMLFK